MKKTLFLLLFLPIVAFLAFDNPQQAVEQAQTVTYRNHSFDLYFVDITQQEVKMYLADKQGVKFHSLGNLKKHLKNQSGVEVYQGLIVYQTQVKLQLPLFMFASKS